MYFQEKAIKCAEDSMTWWKGNECRYPHLASLARIYLAIPATSTPAERVFSVAGIVVDKRRCSLRPAMIDTLVFLNKNNALLNRSQEPAARPKPKLILLPIDAEDGDESDEDDDLPNLVPPVFDGSN